MDPQAYYDTLISKGYDPAIAVQMVKTQYPAWTAPGETPPTYSNPEEPADSISAAPPPDGTTTDGTSGTAPVSATQGFIDELIQALNLKGATPGQFEGIPFDAIAGRYGLTAGQQGFPDYRDTTKTISVGGGYLVYENGAWRFQPTSPEGGTGGTTTPTGWFNENAPPGGIVSPYTAPERPGELGLLPTPQFQAPTLDDLLNDPGYLAQQQAVAQGLERGAAGKGNLLSGGFLGKVLPRTLAENAGSSFGNLYQRRLDAFNTQNAATFGTRGLNETGYENDVTNALNQYKQRYQAYNDAINNQFRLADLGFNAITAGRPS